MAIVNLVGASTKFRALLDEVNLVAPVDSTVLIQGSPSRLGRFVPACAGFCLVG